MKISAFPQLRVWLRRLVKCVLIYLFLGTILYFIQDKIIFVGAYLPFLKKMQERPVGTDESILPLSDGTHLTVWSSRPEKPLDTKWVGIIFHGNGENVSQRNFLPFFNSLGIPAYTFDYNGYGTSTGAPSEEGLYRDADAIWEYVRSRENVTPEQTIVLGNSLGSGPAAYLASKIQPHTLIILAGYSSLRSAVLHLPQYMLFLPFLKYKIPTSEFLSELKKGCVVLAHGRKDGTIPFGELSLLENALNPKVTRKILVSEVASHNDIFYKVENELRAATVDCLSN